MPNTQENQVTNSEKVDAFLLGLADQSNCNEERETFTLYIADKFDSFSPAETATFDRFYYLDGDIENWDAKEEFYLPKGWDFQQSNDNDFSYLITDNNICIGGENISYSELHEAPMTAYVSEGGRKQFVFEKLEPEAPQKKKLSCKSYGLDMHSHWMDEAGLSRNIKAKMIGLASPLTIGYRAKKSLRDFMESQEYDDAQHACDVASGEYPRLLESVAKGLFVASGLIQAGNFERYLSPSNVEVKADYFRDLKAFYIKDRSGKEFCVTLDQVERYFHLISSKAV